MQFKSNFLCCCDSCPRSRNKGIETVDFCVLQNPSGAFEAPLIIPVGIDGTNSEGSYHHGK
uniref:WCCH motif protein n=1 Tax=virus sp. ctEfN2 TaxID=2825810 RepID=A0A8S5RN63_9VIRU|nr:MAG TPA: WCCH motif protein [virus sp. ctEfN2]